MELKLKNVTSYKKDNFTCINLSKKINILYGHNGCGKSTISNFFYNPSHTDYLECECSLIENYRPLVYNSKFIEDNFYNAKEQKGVFTLSKENAEIEKQISAKEEFRESLKNKFLEIKSEIDKLEKNMEDEENDLIRKVWEKSEFVRLTDLKSLMTGSLKSKKLYFSQIRKTPRLPAIDLKELAIEYGNLLKNKNNTLPLITSFAKFIISEEDRDLLSTPIVDTSNSYLSETIKKLQNLDWVKKGREFYLGDNTCPFCQENTINADFLKAIESIFDESYAKKVEQISFIKSAYEAATKYHFKMIRQDILNCELINNNEKDKSLAYVNFLDALADKNLGLISEKIKNPSIVVTLEEDIVTEETLTDDITRFNKIINEINAKVKKFKASEGIITGKMWGGLRDFFNVEFESLLQHEVIFKEKLHHLKTAMSEVELKGKDNNGVIKMLRSQVANIDSTIDSINIRLKNLGIHGFGIKKHAKSEDKYIISRTNNLESANVYKSLSEGEKTLITFLYFLECCKGKTDKDDADTRDTFIVIDDPISSLSQNYVYDIASIIHHEIINNELTKKVLILTHNLYFFHELIKLAPKGKNDKKFNQNYSLGRITKNEFSIITEIKKNSIQNEYQSLWQVLKDAKDGKVSEIIIPNIMRNILEYYFAFVHRTDSLQSELDKLANDDNNSDFKAFYRYINRGSHSDAVNITDMGDISPDKYMKQLQKIFSMTGDEKHYLKMMDEEDEEVATA